MTELVIKAIHRNTKPDTFYLTVLDNGSDKKTKKMLNEMHEQGLIPTFIDMAENTGLEYAREYLRQHHTHGEYFVDIDNDCLPQSIQQSTGIDWLELLKDLMDNYENYGAISCRTQVMIGTGNIFEDESKPITDFPHPGGSLRIMRTKAVEEVGGWNRESYGRGAEERFIGGKLNDAGYKTGFSTHVKTLHLFGLKNTDNWGYDKKLKPQDTGHSPDVWHPIFGSGDDYDEVVKFVGNDLAKEYFND
jgi:GT2 family glycosyltransferase